MYCLAVCFPAALILIILVLRGMLLFLRLYLRLRLTCVCALRAWSALPELLLWLLAVLGMMLFACHSSLVLALPAIPNNLSGFGVIAVVARLTCV